MHWAAIGVVALASTAAACGGEGGSGKSASVLQVATQQTPAQLDSCGASNGSELAYVNVLYAPLIKADDKTGKLGPGLAESWEFSGDKLSLRLTLKPGLKFQDGTVMDAAAVAKSLTQCKKMGNQVPEEVTAITAEGDRTVVFKLGKRYAALPDLLSGRMGMIASPTAREKEGERFASRPVGAGPYKLTDYKPGVSAELTRWDGYTEAGTPAAKVEKIKWRILTDNSALAGEVAAGNVDYAWGFNTTLIAQLKDQPGITLGGNDIATGWTSINLNRSKPPLDDVRVRQAISHAIDRKAMAQAVSGGVWTTPTWGPYPPNSPFYDASVENAQPHDLEKAKELLRQAGHGDGLTIKAVALSSFPYADNAVVLKDQLAKAGIDLQVKTMPTAEATKNFYPGTENLMLISAMGGTSPLYVYPRFYGQDSPANVGKGETAETPLVRELLTTYGEEEQKKIMKRINAVAADDVPFIGLYFIPEPLAWHSDVTGAKETTSVQGNVNLAYLGLDR
ncbi:peptide/nickel transport system substrate-binding protein [Actinomadura meyerae]|uniref:Peptide/nickel transport system substrate-binding protein n=1 Tax=Actinomadura meyerae TaxID=240840 RepID=A0A239NWX0_9ACTN|nr:ABC transporter substrate-binding protein [Actinomadura meyerae]SNT58619.1 peptide/nickel transport system substrate-binding protein [Actinomadura meyerae]